MMFMCS